MSEPTAAHAEGAGAVGAFERTLRCENAANKVASFPLIEYSLELYAHGGPDMRDEAAALSALIEDFAERMRRPR